MVAIQSEADPSYVQGDQANFAGKHLQIATLFYLATMGGASLCCLADEIGSFAPGKHFDALLVSMAPGTSNPSVWTSEHPLIDNVDVEKKTHIIFERFLFGGDDRNILEVFVGGRCIGGRNFDN